MIVLGKRSLELACRETHIPTHMWNGIELYYLHGVPPGDFLSAVFKNDLTEAIGYADNVNETRLSNYVRLLYNHLHPSCYGSKAKFEEWIKVGGLQGQIEKGESDGQQATS